MFLIISTLGWIVYYYSDSSSSQTELPHSMSDMESKSKKKAYEHTIPVRVSTNDYFSWEFVANDVASIYPRRDALVKDILVDIWDSVKVWDTLAVLFEPWVEWETGANVRLKSTRVDSQWKILVQSKKVLNARIGEIDWKIRERQITLDALLENYNQKVKLSENEYDTNKHSLQIEFDKEKKVLATLKTQLENIRVLENNDVETLSIKIANIKNTQSQKKETLIADLENLKNQHVQELVDLENNINEKKELFRIKMNEIYTQLITLIYIWEELNIDYNSISRWKLSDFFSLKNRFNLNDLISNVRDYQSRKDSFDVNIQYELLNSIIDKTIIALESTVPSVGDIAEWTITSYLWRAQAYKSSLASNKEVYNDTQGDISIRKAQQKKEIESIENSIEQIDAETNALILNLQKDTKTEETRWLVDTNNMEKLIDEQHSKIALIESKLLLYNSENSVDLIKSERNLKIWSLQAEISRLRETRKLLITNENMNITRVSNSLLEAKADLNKEYIKSKDYRIISSFSWMVSSRNIEVWQKITQSTESFRLAWVTTSLSKKAKKEIKFYIPESIKNQIEIWKEVNFTFWSDSAKTFTWSIWRISPEVDPENLTLTVQAKVDDSLQIPHKSTIRVWFTTTKEVFKIPSNTLYNKWERKIVYYKKENGKLGVRDVEVVSDDWEFLLITGNIDENLQVVTTPIFIK